MPLSDVGINGKVVRKPDRVKSTARPSRRRNFRTHRSLTRRSAACPGGVPTPLRACARRVQRSGRSTRPPAAGCWSATALGHHSRMATAHPFTTERVANDGPTDDSAVAGCRQGVPSPKNLYVSVTDIAFRRSAWTGDETRLSPGGSEPCARRRRPLGTAPLRCRTPACCARLAEALSRSAVSSPGRSGRGPDRLPRNTSARRLESTRS